MIISVRVQFHFCSGLRLVANDGARQLLGVLRENGATILRTSHASVGKAARHDNPEGDIDEKGNIIICPGLAHPLLKPDAFHPRRKDHVIPSCTFGYIHEARTVRLSQDVNLRKAEQVDAVACGELALAEVLYPRLRPIFGSIDEPGENEPFGQRVRDLEGTYLFWANFFGPPYVERYGRDFLLAAPGWRKEELEDGGILYVVDPSYLHWRTRVANEAAEYFRAKVPGIRPYRSQGFERTEAILEGRLKRKRRRRSDS